MAGVSYEHMRQRQALPLEAKIAFTESRIKAWYLHYYGDVYVSFSGGKDSTVLLDITKRLFPDVPAVFCDTGLEYPEVRELALRKADVVIRPKMNFKHVIEKYGYPIPGKEQALYIRQARNTKSEHIRSLRLGNGRYSVSARWRPLVYAPFEVSEKCCDVIKKAPFKQYAKETGRARMTAMMAYESSRRERSYMLYGCNNFSDKNPSSAPMAIWTEQDVLRYIKESGIEYAACYGEIAETRGGVAPMHAGGQDWLHVLHVRHPLRCDTEPLPTHGARLPEAIRLLHQQAGDRESPRLRGNRLPIPAIVIRGGMR